MIASDPFQKEDHDHRVCIDQALRAAERVCADRRVRLTPLRRKILALVWRGHEPVGAYGLLDALQKDDPKAKAPTVYRALDFLIEQGLIHRIERLNAYVGCSHPEDDGHRGQFLLCTGCGALAELDDGAIDAAILREAEAKGFAVQRAIVEIEGLCPACRKNAEAAA